MDALDVVPGRGVAPFLLGTNIKDIIQFLQRNAGSYGHIISRFNKADPLCYPLCLDIVDFGLELRFNSSSQRLELIRVYDLTKQDYSYGGKIFSSAHITATFLSIHSKFGPTVAGEYADDRSTFQLRYPGVTFLFSIPENLRQTDEVKSQKMPEYDSVVLRTIYIFNSNEDEPHLIEPARPIGYPTPLFIVNPSQGISYKGERSIRFGDAVQDVVSVLGEPTFVSYKTQDPLSIHSGQKAVQKQYDYFYNYFNFGLDILLHGTTHRVKKFVLRANIPTHSFFDLYRKCNFQIIPPRKPSLDIKNDKDDSDDEPFQTVTINPDMKWPAVRDILGSEHSEPFLLPPTKDNQFGGSQFFAYQDLIFEIAMDTSLVSTVTLFKMDLH